MKITFLIIFIFSIAFSTLFSQDKDDVYNSLVDKYGDPKSLSLKFTLRENPTFKGSVTAKKGNKYFIEFGTRSLYSNGVDIWNYSKKDSTVVISKFEEQSNESSIERFFFDYLAAYKPVKLSKESSSSGKPLLILELHPNQDIGSIGDVKRIRISLLPNNYSIVSIVIITDYSTESWDLKDLKTNIRVDDKLFEFVSPSTMSLRIIDLR